jgi:hypothetical protein
MSRGIGSQIRSNAVGYVALFVALTGTAAALPGKATVQSNDIKPNAVKSKHVKDGQVGSSDVADETLVGGDVQDGSLEGVDLAPAALDGDGIRDQSLTGQDIAPDSLTGANIDENTLGGPLVKRCTNGSVLGAIRVNGNEQFNSFFTAAGTQGFTCSLSSPMARRTAAGVYEACFPSGALSASDFNLAIGSAVQTGVGSAGEDNFVSVGTKTTLPACDDGDGAVFEVRVQDIGDSGATLQDGVFVLAVVD